MSDSYDSIWDWSGGPGEGTDVYSKGISPQSGYEPARSAGYGPWTAGQDVASGYDYGNMYTPPMDEGGSAQYRSMPYSAPPQQFMPGPQQPQQGITQTMGGLLSALGPLAWLFGGLASRGVTGTQSQQMPFQGRVAGTQAQGALGQLGQQASYNTPLQQMQMSLLQALQSGQGLPPGYQRLIEQAFQPQMGNIATQAIESARNRGFAGGADLLNSGPGGAIAGPALADLQGQMAQSKLGLMTSLPGLYNQPIQQQGQAMQQQAQGYGNLMGQYGNYGGTQQQAIPMGQQIGQGVGNVMAGAYGGMNSANQSNQNQNFNNFLMKAIQGMSGGQQQQGGMDFSQMYPTG